MEFTTTTLQPKESEYEWLEVVALQAMDCIGNCINQSLWVGLLWDKDNWRDTNCQTHFTNIFAFLLSQLLTTLNITTIDTIISFYAESIKHHAPHGFKLRRAHFDASSTPLPIASELTATIAVQIPRIFKL